MVEDRIEDGKRTAQLLASELTGLATGPLDRIDVADADPDAEPSDGGTFAYEIVLDGDPLGEVFVHEDSARVDLAVGDASPGDVTDAAGLAVTDTDDGVRIRIEHGAAVKRAVDVLVAVVEERER